MIFVGSLALYLGAGLVTAALFLSVGITRVFGHRVSVTIGARLLILPGTIVLWPIVLCRWLKVRTPG